MAIPTFQEKQLSTFTVVKLGLVPPTGSPTLEIFGRIKDFQAPKRERTTLEVPELRPTDSSGTELPGDAQELGDEVLGEFSFTHYHRWNHPQAKLLDDAFDDNSEFKVELTSTHADTPATMTFNGRIKSLNPAQCAKGEYYQREVVFVRTSAIVVADAA